MSTSPLSPQGASTAAEAHKELGPEYSDAVVKSFLERVEPGMRGTSWRARLGPASRDQGPQQAQ